VFGVADLEIFFGILTIVANASEVSHDLASRNRRLFLRKRRTVFLYRRVEIELPALVQLHRSDRRERLRARGKPVQCAGCGRHEVFEIGHAEARGPDELSVFDHGN
jgi:hypothetical protein